MDFVVNYWAVLVCGIAAMAVGGLWYGALFGRTWAREMGFNTTDSEVLARMKRDSKKS
jgi:hypothetical protein